MIVGELVHANPHYTVMIQANGTEAARETLIPAELIAEVIR